MDNAGANLSKEIEERIGPNGVHCRNVQAEDEDRKQQYAASDPRHSNESPYEQPHQALNQ